MLFRSKGSPVCEMPLGGAFRTWTRIDWAAPDCTPGRGARNRGDFRDNVPGFVIKISVLNHNRYSTSEADNHPGSHSHSNRLKCLRL